MKAPKVPRIVGSYAGQFLAILTAFGCAGLAWGAWRPDIRGTISEDGGVEITDPAVLNSSVEFSTFGVMVLCFLALGLVLAISDAVRMRSRLSIVSLLWGALSTVVGSVTFFTLGTRLALQRVGIPDVNDLRVGAEVRYLPEVNLGVAILVAPVVYLITCWCAAVFRGDADGGGRADSASNRAIVFG